MRPDEHSPFAALLGIFLAAALLILAMHENGVRPDDARRPGDRARSYVSDVEPAYREDHYP